MTGIRKVIQNAFTRFSLKTAGCNIFWDKKLKVQMKKIKLDEPHLVK